VPKIVDHDARRRELAAAVGRVIARDGVGEVSIRSVAAESGWSSGALRHYFATRGELLAFACEQVIDQVAERIRAMPQPDDVRRGMRAILLETMPVDERRHAESTIAFSFLALGLGDPALARVQRLHFTRMYELCVLLMTGLAAHDQSAGVAARNGSAVVAARDGSAVVAAGDESAGVVARDESAGVAARDESAGVAAGDESAGVAARDEAAQLGSRDGALPAAPGVEGAAPDMEGASPGVDDASPGVEAAARRLHALVDGLTVHVLAGHLTPDEMVSRLDDYLAELTT
jgi:AcrR family transcriptional regulator